MNDSEIISLVETIIGLRSESNFIEVKKAANGCPKIFDTLSSFSNQRDGGVILFGIDESNDFDVCGVYDAADLQKKISEQCLQMEPAVKALCSVCDFYGKTVVCAEIPEIEDFQKPCYYKGAGRLRGSFTRVGDSDRQMTDYEIYSYEAFRKKIEDELRPVERADIRELHTKEMLAFKKILAEKKPKVAALDPRKVLQLLGFVSDAHPTITGLFMFGEYPQGFFPQLCITAVSVGGTEFCSTNNISERFLDNNRIEGTIRQMFECAMTFVKRNMKYRTVIDENTGKRDDVPEYPIIAIREIIINALVHRDYSIHTDNCPITIKMFSNRIEVENPGGLYGRTTLDTIGEYGADTRNPYLANALEIFGQTENRYSGIPTIRRAMEEFHLKAPLFENSRGTFRVTLFNEPEKVTGKVDGLEAEILEFCKTPKSRNQLQEKFSDRITIAYLMAKHIAPMVEKGLLKLSIPEKPKSKKQTYTTV